MRTGEKSKLIARESEWEHGGLIAKPSWTDPAEEAAWRHPVAYDVGNLVWLCDFRTDVCAMRLNEQIAEVIARPISDISQSQFWYHVCILDPLTLTPSRCTL